MPLEKPTYINRAVKNKDNPFTVVSNLIATNPALTLEEIGICTIILSFSDDYKFGVADILKRCNSNEKRIRKTLSLLEEKNLLQKVSRTRTLSGLFRGGYTYIFNENAFINEPLTTLPKVNNGQLENKFKKLYEKLNSKEFYPLSKSPPVDNGNTIKIPEEKNINNQNHQMDFKNEVTSEKNLTKVLADWNIKPNNTPEYEKLLTLPEEFISNEIAKVTEISKNKPVKDKRAYLLSCLKKSITDSFKSNKNKDLKDNKNIIRFLSFFISKGWVFDTNHLAEYILKDFDKKESRTYQYLLESAYLISLEDLKDLLLTEISQTIFFEKYKEKVPQLLNWFSKLKSNNSLLSA